MDTPALPIVAVDVDGVLNPRRPDPADGWQPHQLTVPASALPDSPFLVGGGRQDLTGRVWLNRELGRWLQGLRGRANVVWATTWETAANSHLAPLLGIDPLPVVDLRSGVPFGIVAHHDSAAAKAWRLADVAAEHGAPLLWLDDGNLGWAADTWLGGRGVAVPVDPDCGLTAENRALVEDFVAWGAAAGPADVFALVGHPPAGTWRAATGDGHVLDLDVAGGLPWARLPDRLRWRRPDGSRVELADALLIECRVGAPLHAVLELANGIETETTLGLVTELAGAPAGED